MSEFLWVHGLQHARLLRPPLSPRVCSNSCSLSQWCYLTISFSASSFFFCLQSFLALGSFPVSWLFKSGGQSTGVSVSASVLPMNIQGWFPLGLTDLISLQSKDSQKSSPFMHAGHQSYHTDTLNTEYQQDTKLDIKNTVKRETDSMPLLTNCSL